MDRTTDLASPGTGRKASRSAVGALAAVGGGLCVAAAAVAAASPFEPHTGLAIVAHTLVIGAPIGAGLYAVSQPRASRFGWLLILAGLLWAPTLLAESGDSLPYSIGRVAGWLVEPTLIYLVLAFPLGRLTARIDRALFGASVVLLGVFYLPTALLVHQYPLPIPWTGCTSGCPSNAFMVSATQPGWIDAAVVPVREFALVLVLLGVTVVLARRVTHGTRLTRRTLAPVITLAIVRVTLTAVYLLSRRAAPDSSVTEVLGTITLLATPALAVGFFIGLVRWRVFAVSAVRRLMSDAIGPSSAGNVRELLSSAFEDPTLEIVYWAPDAMRWVDSAGKPYALPGPGSDRAVTQVSDRGRLVAAFVHDRALADQPILSEVAQGFALVALENERLDAELHSSLHELRESRARIVSAADKERQRIERDLHDGAQQRLVALGIKLELAREQSESEAGDSTDLLREMGRDVDEALWEVQALAQGVYPTHLAQRGLAEALRQATAGGNLEITIDAPGLGRYAQETESAVYFCCLEALQNAAKHASGATVVRIVFAEAEDEQLTFEVRDDGPGLSEGRGEGAGLDNMRDRIAAVGGSLEVASARGGGTRVTGQVPLGPADLPPELETLLRRATDALDDCFGIVRAVRDERGAAVDFFVEHVNDEACRDIGYAREEAIGRTLGDLVPGYLSSAAFEFHRRVLAGSGPVSSEDLDFAGPVSDASHLRRAYDVRGAPLGGGRVVLSWREITEHKRNELELELQSLVLDRTAEGLCLVRASDNVIVYANPRYGEMFGYGPGELEGMPVSALNWDERPGDAERELDKIIVALEQGDRETFEVHNRRKDGTPFWTAAHVTAFDHADHGRVWATLQQEISGHREAPIRPEVFAPPLRAVARAPLMLFTLDRELRYTWILNNQTALDDHDAVGKTNEELFGSDAARPLTAIKRRVVETGIGIRTELELELPRGRSRLELAVDPLRGPDGRVEGVAGVVFDITEEQDARLERRGRFSRARSA